MVSSPSAHRGSYLRDGRDFLVPVGIQKAFTHAVVVPSYLRRSDARFNLVHAKATASMRPGLVLSAYPSLVADRASKPWTCGWQWLPATQFGKHGRAAGHPRIRPSRSGEFRRTSHKGTPSQEQHSALRDPCEPA